MDLEQERTKKQIYLAELDDDYQELLNIESKELIRRTYCYILLSDGLVIHPAFIWQSHLVNDLVFNKLSDIFAPPLIQIALGDSDMVSDYMPERINRLDKSRNKTKELLKYKKWQSQILTQAKILDAKFSNSSSYHNKESRDKKFRKLLAHDVAVNNTISTIKFLIKVSVENEQLGIDVAEIAEKLSNHINKSELVSMETFLNKLRSLGLVKLSEDIFLKRRILHLYTLANLDDRLVAPGISDLDSNCIFRPFDHNVFWVVFSKLFGKKVSSLLSTKTDREIVYTIKQLTESNVWVNFRNVYFSVLSEANLALKGKRNL